MQTLRRYLASIRTRDDREDEQLFGRFLVCVASTAAYVAVPAPPVVGLMIGSICTVVALISLALLYVAKQPQNAAPSPARRHAMLAVDIIALTSMLHLGGQYAAVFWGFFLWIPLDYGFRYGPRYLRTTVPFAALGFTIPLLVGDSFWRESIWLWASMQLTLIVVPLAVLHQVKTNDATNRAIRKSSQQKTRLLGHLTSTLQTPLGGILRAAEAIQHAPDRAATLVDVIALSARHLIILTQDMLDTAAIEAGQLRRQECAFDVREVAGEAVAALLAAAESKNVMFRVQVDETVPELVYADLAHLRQILVYCLDRLLACATREVTLRIGARSSVGLTTLRFDVTTSDANTLVERAYLSVTMAPALIQFLGGETGVIEDKVIDNNAGSVGIWVTLPCTSIEKPKPEPVATDSENVLAFTDIFIRHRRTVPKLRLLVIDDQSSARFMLESIMSKAGHAVDTATTGDEGLTALDQAATDKRPYDAILLDLHLPDQPGANVIRMINYLQVGQRTPLIVITADRSDAALASCRDAGVAAFLSKPIKPGQLLDAVAFAASLRPGGQSTAPPQVPAELAAALVHEDGLAREFVRRCLSDAEAALGRLNSAAVTMDWPDAAEHAYAVYAVAVNTTNRPLIEAAAALHQLPAPSFKIYWREHAERVRSAIGQLRELNNQTGA